MDLPHSDDCFVVAFPAETTEAFLEGHVRAFAYFGGVPTRILYDNTKIAVARILGGEERLRTRAFSELQSHYLFADKFGRPAKGNDKGKVEGLVGYARRNFMVPVPRVNSWDELNASLEAQCRKRRERRLRGHTETIGERFERDRALLLPLPTAPYEACEKVTTRVSSLALVRYRGNDYSVPTRHGHLQVLVRGYVHEVTVACASEIIARHPRSYEREAVVFDPLHYLALLEHKSRALDQAAPLTGWELPECFIELRRLIEARLLKQASREYIQVLRLLENFPPEEVTAAVEAALRLRAAHRRSTGPHHPPRPYPGNERRQLPAQAKPPQTILGKRKLTPRPNALRGRRAASATLQRPSSPENLPSDPYWLPFTPPHWLLFVPPLTVFACR
jgi:hypothetical protein